MSEQAPLFGDLYRQVAPKAMPETASREARQSLPALSDMHERILRTLKFYGPLTDEQIQRTLRIPANTQRPRRREFQKMAKIRPAGEGRTLSGRRATTWSVVP